MEDIKEVLEMFEPTAEFIASLTERGPYIILTKTGILKTAYFYTYKTVPPKFEETSKYPSKYTMSQIKYIFKLKKQ